MKRRAKRGDVPFASGIGLLILGALLAVVNLTTTTVRYVPGIGSVESQGTPSVAAWVLLAAGVILASLGYLKRR